jgi:hypothetical protein
VAEYEALVNGPHTAIELGIRLFDVQGDSQFVVGQVMKDSECRDPNMIVCYKEVRHLKDMFSDLKLNHALQWDNKAPDALVNMASRRGTIPLGVFANDPFELTVRYDKTCRESSQPLSISPSTLNTVAIIEGGKDALVDSSNDWRTPYHDYMLNSMLPELRWRHEGYFDEPILHPHWQRLVQERAYRGEATMHLDQARKAAHEGHPWGSLRTPCHPRSLMRRASLQGFYWPTMSVRSAAGNAHL